MTDFGAWCRTVRRARARLTEVPESSNAVALDRFLSILCADLFAYQLGLPQRPSEQSPHRYLLQHLEIEFPFCARSDVLWRGGDNHSQFSTSDVEAIVRCPTLLGWAYQVWNEKKRTDSTWGVSYRDANQPQNLSISAATQIFTEEYMADFLVERCSVLTAQTISDVRVIDPACGTGHILARALCRLADESSTRSAIERVYGCDIDPLAVEICRVVLLLECIRLDHSSLQFAWRAVTENIRELVCEYGTLDREVLPFSKHALFDWVITNPPYLGRRKLTSEMRDFLDREYPHSALDLCTAFMDRSLELAAPDGAVGFVTSDKWLRLRGYHAFRSGGERYKGLYQRLALDVIAELGDRAFRPQLALHDGVGVVLTVGRHRTPRLEHRVSYLSCSRARSSDEKAAYLKGCTDHCEMNVFLEQAALCGDIDGSVFLHAGGAPQSLGTTRRHVADYARVVVGLQTNDDDRFVRYHWQVVPDPTRWRIHNKGGGYARWFGLNRWVLDVGSAEALRRDWTREGGALQSLFAQAGWTYSWFANGCLGVRQKDEGWSFGRAASSGLYCEDPRLVAYLNARVASLCARLIGGKVQLPEGVVRGIPVPDDLSPISGELVELAVRIKREIVSADPTDVTFRGYGWPRVEERLALEALLLVVEGVLDEQVSMSVSMSDEEQRTLSNAISPPVSSPGITCSAGHYEALWRVLSPQWHTARPLVDPFLGLRDELCEGELDPRQVQSLLFSPAGRRADPRAFPVNGPLERLCRGLALHPVTAWHLVMTLQESDISLRRALSAFDAKLDILTAVLRTLGWRWWGESPHGRERRSHTVADLTDSVRASVAVEDVHAVLSTSIAEWIEVEMGEWQRTLFLNVPILHLHPSTGKGATVVSLIDTEE